MSVPAPATAAGDEQQPSGRSAAAISKTATTALQLVLRNLSDALVYTDSNNIDTNKKLWDRYCSSYYDSDKDKSTPSQWVQRMASQVGRTAQQLQHIGDEWSDVQSLDRCLARWLYPLLSESSVVAEIGSGGGRVASRVAGRVKQLACFDISDRMLSAAQAALSHHNNCTFHLLSPTQPTPASFPPHLHHTFDTVYAFDVLVHCTPHTIHAYLTALHCLLRPASSSGRLLIHYADMTTPLGWQRFERQKDETAGGFCFVGRDQVREMCDRAGWEVVGESECLDEADWEEAGGSVYEQRDRLCVLRESEGWQPTSSRSNG